MQWLRTYDYQYNYDVNVIRKKLKNEIKEKKGTIIITKNKSNGRDAGADSLPYTVSVVNRAERQSKLNHPGYLAPSASPI